jgi:hypothetical protein
MAPTAAPVVPPEQIQQAARDIQMTVADAAGVGAQNQPRPSYASDAQRRATEVSRILESKLQERLKPDFGDILSASLQTLSGRGRTNFATALREEESKDLGRAYNIANALSGLQRGAAAGELRPADLLRFAERQAERGDVRVKMVLDQVNQAARGFEDEPSARENLLSAVMEVDSPEKTPVQVIKEAVELVRAGGLASKQPRAAATTGTATGGTGGVTKDANGMWVAAPGQRLTQDQAQSNLSRQQGDPTTADRIDQRIKERAMGVGGRGADPADRYAKAYEGSQVALGLIDRTRDILRNNPQAVGVAGTLGLFARGVEAQARALMNTPVQFSTGGGNYRDVDAKLLADKASAQMIWDRVASGTDLKTRFAWLDRAPEAQAMRTNLLLLAFAVARAIEPGGRLSNQDVSGVLNALGAGGSQIFTDPRSMARALDEVEAYVKSSTNAAYRGAVQRSPDLGKVNPNEPYPMGAPQPAAAPTASPQTGATSAPSAARFSEGAIAVNPSTGQRVRFTNGRWEPVQ